MLSGRTDADGARGTAARLLDTTSERWQHVAGVAAAARAVVDVVPPADAEVLVAAAWLHDIGYTARSTLPTRGGRTAWSCWSLTTRMRR